MKNTKELIQWLEDRSDEELPDIYELIGAAYGKVHAKEYRAREHMIFDVIRAKREIGLKGSEMELSFFKDIWPKARDALLNK